MSAETCAKLSVVAIGRNEGERLRACLESVRAMHRGAWEVELIYVDSGSSDDSVAIAASLGAKTIALRPQHPTAALGRNAGWRAASGDVVLFLDGDTVLAPDFAVRALPEFEDASIACVWGHRREMYPRRSVYNRVMDLDWVYAPGITAFCGGDSLWRREVLEQLGGFDERLIAGEEPELCRRTMFGGYKVLHVDCAMTKHDLAIVRFSQYWRRCSRAGHAYAEIAQRFAGSTEPFWTDEVRRNRRRAVGLCGMALAAAVAGAWLRSAWPLATITVMLMALVLRTAWKARWKSGDGVTLLLYGIHSHLQQLPIFAGQMQFQWNRRHGQQAQLVEYKLP